MHADWSHESEKLDAVLRFIAEELAAKTGKSDAYKREMRAINKSMWEEVGGLSGHATFDATPAFMQEIGFLKRNAADASKTRKEIAMLERQFRSPYFCRIDFREEGYGAESFYIGVYGLQRHAAGEIVVYDWRAPLSSMFYDYEPGPARYECPSGHVAGELLLKRQYRIENGTLVLMFDSTLAVGDSILQDILAGSADNRMKTIVSTIQKEQNRAIRCEGKRVLAVQGPAGSGKTSIALHRAAYLLYRHKDSLNAGNICLFTPSGIFADYISSILPELGEDDIPGRTITGLVKDALYLSEKDGKRGTVRKRETTREYETYAEMMEWQLAHNYPEYRCIRLEGIRFKASRRFAAILEKFIDKIESDIIRFEDVIFDDTVFVSRSELEELFHVTYRHMPIIKRLARMELLLPERISKYVGIKRKVKEEELADSGEYVNAGEIKARSRMFVAGEMEETRDRIKSMLSIDVVSLYRMLFNDPAILASCGGTLSEKARIATAEALEHGVLHYEDQAPVLYLMLLLGMTGVDEETRHVIIDEAQDYSEFTYLLFSKLYPGCGITLLGDSCQNINPACGIGDLRSAGELSAPGDFEYVKLEKSYRSTVEIMDFASRIMKPEALPFGRHGDTPRVIVSGSLGEVCKSAADSINDAKENGCRSVAVICRTSYDCRRIHDDLSEHLPVTLVASGDVDMPKGIAVIPSYLAKGLEFDAVIALMLSKEDYLHDERQLLYTVCTRALHRLYVCGMGTNAAMLLMNGH